MARDSETQRPGSWRQLLLVGTAVLAVGLATGVSVWQVGRHDPRGRSASRVQQRVQPAPPQDGAVQAAAVPVPVGSVTARPVADPTLVLVASDTQAANAQQNIAEADALLAMQGLPPLNASIVVAAAEPTDGLQQGIGAANAICVARALPPLTLVDLR
jgi:hypothetical protein